MYKRYALKAWYKLPNGSQVNTDKEHCALLEHRGYLHRCMYMFGATYEIETIKKRMVENRFASQVFEDQMPYHRKLLTSTALLTFSLKIFYGNSKRILEILKKKNVCLRIAHPFVSPSFTG